MFQVVSFLVRCGDQCGGHCAKFLHVVNVSSTAANDLVESISLYIIFAF